MKILIIDDDREHLDFLAQYLEQRGFFPLPAGDIEQAEEQLKLGPDFAIVDLFLSGDRGAELSNVFIRECLVPAKIAYGRMTSAPSLVPDDLAGDWICDKRQFWRDPDVLWPLLKASTQSRSDALGRNHRP